jgi:chromosomal replication initiator protein
MRTEHPDLYRSWFEELPAPQLDHGELRFEIDDPIRAAYLRDACTGAFTHLAIQLSGMLVAVRFVTKASGSAPITSEAQAEPLTSAPLGPDYTFDQFVVGTSNRLAHAACRAVCSQSGTLYNPLFIHGRSGLGKSHLLQAVCADQLARPNSPHVIYLSCESFVNDFVRALQTGRLGVFRDRARCADILAIDDVQFLANREDSQEELFHTFNALYQSRKQLILSADASPAEIPTLQDRLISRFNWGLVTQIDVPGRETRPAILQKKARLRGQEVPDEILDLIAERVESNVRILEGALTKLISETQINGKPMNIETANDVLSEVNIAPTKPLQINDILEVVTAHFGLRVADLLGRKRSRSISFPRQVGMYLARKLTPFSLEEIGAHFGGRDHSTVLHAERTIQNDARHDRETTDMLNALSRQLLHRR